MSLWLVERRYRRHPVGWRVLVMSLNVVMAEVGDGRHIYDSGAA